MQYGKTNYSSKELIDILDSSTKFMDDNWLFNAFLAEAPLEITVDTQIMQFNFEYNQATIHRGQCIFNFKFSSSYRILGCSH